MGPDMSKKSIYENSTFSIKKMQAGCENEDKSNQSYYGYIEK